MTPLFRFGMRRAICAAYRVPSRRRYIHTYHLSRALAPAEQEHLRGRANDFSSRGRHQRVVS
jgi:hypothetical protein